MLSEYVVVLVFAAIALLVPISILAFSKLIRQKTAPNAVQEENYESGEESVGIKTGIMNEYLVFFPLFLTFEIITAILLIWSTFAGAMAEVDSILILMIPVVGLAFAFAVLAIARAKSAQHAAW
jgi:NADH:ubiquinone oxidoreductase subunit 3 (subunit A)